MNKLGTKTSGKAEDEEVAKEAVFGGDDEATPTKAKAAGGDEEADVLPGAEKRGEAEESGTHRYRDFDGHVPPCPAPTALQRQNNLQSRPGAHPVAGPMEADNERDIVVATAETELCFSADVEIPTGSNYSKESDLYEARIVPGTNQRRSRTKGWIALAALGVVGVAVILVSAFLLQSPEEAERQPLKEEPVQIEVSYDVPFSSDLPGMVMDFIRYERDGPFHKANRWLLTDPNLQNYSMPRLMQRFYLATIFYSTNGEGWIQNDNWLSYTVSECEWFSSSSYSSDSPYYEPRICDNHGTFINLSLSSNNLTGSLPIWYTSFLPYLLVFDVGYNQIGGYWPPITTSEYLEVCNIAHYLAQGTPIVNVGSTFVNLRAFEVEYATSEGRFDGAFYQLVPNLELYNVTGVELIGTLHPNIGILTNLQYIAYGDTRTVGTIPSELGLLTDLVHLDLTKLPNFYGTLPSEVGLLTKLTWLDLLNTPVTGSVPPSLCQRADDGSLELRVDCGFLECCS